MAAKFAELWVEIGAKLDNFNRGMADVDKATQRMARRLDRVGKQMTMRVTLPLLALGGAAVKMSADFDKGMTESLAIMDNVSPAMRAEMEKTAKQMSEESTFASKELAASYFFLASAGMDAAQSIKALPIVTKFAQAGTFDLATATDLLTDAQTALGLSSKNVEKNQKNLLRVSDVLVRANTLANAKVRQFSEALTNRAAPALRMVGKDIEEGVAVLAAFADQGRKGGEAGEAFSIVLRDLQRAALGNEEAFKRAGVTVYDTSGEMVNIADIIGDLEKLFEGMSDKQKKASMTILGFQERSQANILTLIGMSDKIRIYEKELRKAGGTTERVSKKQLEAFSNQMTVLKNKLMNVGIQIGDILIPIIKELVDEHIEPAVKWFSELSEGSKTLAVKVAFLAAVMGPLVLMMAKLAKSFIAIKAAAPAVAAGFGPIAAGAMLAYYASKLAYEVRDRYEGKLSKEEQARDDEIKQWQDLAEAVGGFTDFLLNAEKAEVLTVEKRRQIWKKYQKEGPIAAFKAITEGKEGEALQKFFIEASGYTDETTEAMEKLEKEIKGLLGAFDLFAGSEKKLLQLKEQMTDEYMQLTLGEYEYRKWAALQGYTDRLEILKKEKANDADFAMAKKVYLAELVQIEKDQTKELQKEWNERAIMLQTAIDEGFEAQKTAIEKIQELHEGYTDIVKELTLSEKDYRLWALDEWYAAELAKLGTNLEAKAVLEQAYALKKEKIDDDTVASQMSMFEKIGTAAIIALGQSKMGAIAQAIMSTYAGAAKTIEMLGMPFAIPFIAMAILTGFKQVAAIRATSIPSAEMGAYLSRPTLIEAGHGPKGEIIASPEKLAEIISREMPKLRPDAMAIQSSPIQLEVNIYAQTLDHDTVRKAGELIYNELEYQQTRRGR